MNNIKNNTYVLMFNSNLHIIISIIFGFPNPIFPHKVLTCASLFTFHVNPEIGKGLQFIIYARNCRIWL